MKWVLPGNLGYWGCEYWLLRHTSIAVPSTWILLIEEWIKVMSKSKMSTYYSLKRCPGNQSHTKYMTYTGNTINFTEQKYNMAGKIQL